MSEDIRPSYYGGKNNPFEPIKIIQHYGLCFEISNALKYCLRAGVKNKETEIEDLVKAKTYLQLRIDYLQAQKEEQEKKKWHDDVSPKLISELKVGDEIKAIDECGMSDDIYLDRNALIIGNNYKIKRIYNGELDISSELYETHTFDLKDLHEYFHVSKE